MNPTRSSTNQLLPNRGILTKINAVVRKKSHERNIQIPSEWEESTAQSYRLLVGPKINEFITPESENDDNLQSNESELDQTSQQQAKVLQKLRASRIKEPVEPLNRPKISFDALHFPPDLLVHCVSPDTVKNFDLLNKSLKTKTRKIIKPTVKSLDLSRPPSSLLQSAADSSRVIEKENKIRNLRKLEEENSQTNSNFVAIVVNTELPSTESDKTEINPLLLNTSARIRLKNLIKLRTYFYVLRCWAHYKINARIKASFLLSVHNTQIQIHFFDSWHEYVKTIKKLRNYRKECEQLIYNRTINRLFNTWKTRAAKAIQNAETANLALVLFHAKMKRDVFIQFHEAAHSRRVYHKEVEQFFRYQPEGPYAPINEYYTTKRNNKIKYLHFLFIKKIPPLIRAWNAIVQRTHSDNDKTNQISKMKKTQFFNGWFDIYHDHFHRRQIYQVRQLSLARIEEINKREQEAAENVEKTVMMQLIRDRNVLNIKLNQFDRLSQNHHEAVLRRRQMRSKITSTTNNFFERQEELQFIDYNRQATEIERKTREIRIQLAEGFLYHIRRSIRSLQNQAVAAQFCIAFRTLSEPVVQRAIGYFYEKKHMKHLVRCAQKERTSLKSAVKCSTLFHQHRGWIWWKKYLEKAKQSRTEGLMEVIRRRTEVLQLYPYFNWTEVLPVRPPRPLKEIEQMFKDLPLVSLQRKIERERLHHVNVKLLLMRRRMLRDFTRAWVAYVQQMMATREVMKLLRRKQHLRLMRLSFKALQANATNTEVTAQIESIELEVDSNIIAWERHFFRARNEQTRLTRTIPYS